MEEEEERRARKEEEDEEKEGRSATTRRLWNAIENNLKRELGKRQKLICLSAAQMETLENNARCVMNDCD